MSTVIKTSKRYFDQDIADYSSQLDTMRQSKQYKAILKASANNEIMCADIFFQHMLGDGEIFNPYELRSNIDAEQLQYQRMVSGEWIEDDTQVPTGRMVTLYELADLLFGHNRTDKQGNLMDSVAKGERVATGQRNKAIAKKRDNLQGKGSFSDEEINNDLKRSSANRRATDIAKSFHLLLETLYFEQTGEVYMTSYQKDSKISQVKEGNADMEAQAEAEIAKLEQGLGNVPSDASDKLLDVNSVK